MTGHLIFIHDAAGLRQHESQVMPLVRRCVERAVHGEFTAENVREEIEAGRAVAFCAEEDGAVVLASVVLLYLWPSGKLCAELEAIGGRDLSKNWKRYKPQILAFLRAAGVDAFVAQCSPGMERLLGMTGDWKPLYRVVQCELGESDVHD